MTGFLMKRLALGILMLRILFCRVEHEWYWLGPKPLTKFSFCLKLSIWELFCIEESISVRIGRDFFDFFRGLSEGSVGLESDSVS